MQTTSASTRPETLDELADAIADLASALRDQTLSGDLDRLYPREPQTALARAEAYLSARRRGEDVELPGSWVEILNGLDGELLLPDYDSLAFVGTDGPAAVFIGERRVGDMTGAFIELVPWSLIGRFSGDFGAWV